MYQRDIACFCVILSDTLAARIWRLNWQNAIPTLENGKRSVCPVSVALRATQTRRTCQITIFVASRFVHKPSDPIGLDRNEVVAACLAVVDAEGLPLSPGPLARKAAPRHAIDDLKLLEELPPPRLPLFALLLG